MKKKEQTWDEVAADCMTTRRSLLKWRHLPGAPKGKDVAEWRAFMIANNLGSSGDAPANAEAREAKLSKTKLETQLLRARLDREERRSIPRDEVTKLLFTLASRLNSIVAQTFETELPPKLDGMSSVQMRPILREEGDKFRAALSDAVKEFESR